MTNQSQKEQGRKCLPGFHKKGREEHETAGDGIVCEKSIYCAKCDKEIYYWAYGSVVYESFLLVDFIRNPFRRIRTWANLIMSELSRDKNIPF